jgi:methionyl-tRNA formyltransferase
MRLVFLGSPESVLAPLKTLLTVGPTHGHQVAGVVSQPPRAVGRSQTPVDPPVAAFAKNAGLPTLQPEKASDPAFLEAFAALAPDVAITAAYGQILTEAFLAIPRRATINIHPSLLPRYRGATPVPAALLEGETVTGVTVLFTVKRLDAGNILVQETVPIGPEETAGPLTDRLFALGGDLTLKALALLADPAEKGSPQDEARVTHCRKIQKQDGAVDWSQGSEEIVHRFRAYAPWPGSYTFLGDRRLALVAMRASADGMHGLAAGEVVFDKRHRCLNVGTGDGTVQVTTLKPAGGKDVQAEAFWNGLKDRSRVRFTAAPA